MKYSIIKTLPYFIFGTLILGTVYFFGILDVLPYIPDLVLADVGVTLTVPYLNSVVVSILGVVYSDNPDFWRWLSSSVLALILVIIITGALGLEFPKMQRCSLFAMCVLAFIEAAISFWNDNIYHMQNMIISSIFFLVSILAYVRSLKDT